MVFGMVLGAVRDVAVCVCWATGGAARSRRQAGRGRRLAEDPSTPDEAPTAKSPETTLIVIAAAVAIAVFLSIVCSLLGFGEPCLRAPYTTRADEGRRTDRMKLP